MPGTLQIDDLIHLDARRAAWLPKVRALVVADLHLGRLWTQRSRGQLVPVGLPDDATTRLAALVADYQPERLVILGDLVHEALRHSGVREALDELVAACGPSIRIELVLGNHDRRVQERIVEWKLPISTSPHLEISELLLFHGDTVPAASAPMVRRRIQGHEHPAVVLGDGVATSAKVPCFVSGPGHLILPAFSGQASGCVLGRHPLIGPAVRAADLDTVYACLGRHLLRMPMEVAISSARFLNEDSQRKKTPELKGVTEGAKGGSDERLKG
jgi:putative SbcD/Mre11-related phosphoesterase